MQSVEYRSNQIKLRMEKSHASDILAHYGNELMTGWKNESGAVVRAKCSYTCNILLMKF